MAKKQKKRPYSTQYQAASPEAAKRYLLSGIPPGLWRKFQARCKREHVAMRQVILSHVEEWTNRPPATQAVPAAIETPTARTLRSLVLPGQLGLFEQDTIVVPGRQTSAAATGRARAPRRRGSPA